VLTREGSDRCLESGETASQNWQAAGDAGKPIAGYQLTIGDLPARQVQVSSLIGADVAALSILSR
jgi:hypothetical protein